tara:strand:+ start:315 stop:503 length:189 start_codon:yes stop_codon:yes gene_type:complete
MNKLKSALEGKKTNIVSALLVVVSVIELITGDITLSEFLSGPNLLVFLNGIGLASLHAGIKR